MANVISNVGDLNGLILTGGKSSRMGEDKSLIEYHSKPQSQYLYELVKEFLPNTYLSVRGGQQFNYQCDVIEDQLSTKGPINGILSAMKLYPDKAWLVLACDLPLMTRETIKYLIEERDQSKLATAYATDKTGLPEPLVAIWEYSALEALSQHHLVEEKNCP
ncbi:MAG: molybdenum cofactor guanylyltransferase, partial [Cytophagales bacterium]|nr:molybdenum cofactor guanylyltransferase [Cytophagales bacterium]